jgi:signal transduction histidine kinase
VRRFATVRARVTSLATIAVLVVLVLGGLMLVIQQRRLLTETVDEALQEHADELEAMGSDAPPLITRLGDDDTMAQIVEDGRVVASSANVRGLPPVADAAPVGDESIRRVDELPHEATPFRLLARGVEVDGSRRTILVGASLDDVQESTTTLSRSLLLAVPLVVAGLALVVWWLIGRTLRSVEAIRAEVAAIGGSQLHRRVPVPSGDDEIARLAHTMNGMLDRVEGAAERQQRFLADASHELRSPLTRVRAELEVDLAHPEGADLRATHRSVLDETIGLQRLTEDLLLVARDDAGAAAVTRDERVDLDDLVVRISRRLRASDRVSVDLGAVTAAQVQGDPDQLARLVGNLADNAVRHAAGTVAFTLAEVGEEAVLTVSDDGPGIPEADRERVFERFARVDGSRTAGHGGAGLGLAIARDIATRHGGSLTVEPAGDLPGAHFVLRLPLAR